MISLVLGLAACAPHIDPGPIRAELSREPVAIIASPNHFLSKYLLHRYNGSRAPPTIPPERMASRTWWPRPWSKGALAAEARKISRTLSSRAVASYRYSSIANG